MVTDTLVALKEPMTVEVSTLEVAVEGFKNGLHSSLRLCLGLEDLVRGFTDFENSWC